MALAETTTRTSRGPWVWPRFTRDYTRNSVAALLWTLHDLGGVIESDAGRAGSMLATAAEERGTPIAPRLHLSAIFAELEEGGIYGACILRDKHRPKRTYKITLLLAEDEMPPKPRHLKAAPERTISVQPVASDPEPQPEPEPAPVPPEPQPQPEPVEDVVTPEIPPLVVLSEEPLDLALTAADDIAKVIQALLVQGARPAEPNSDTEEISVRLAQTIEENNRLRRKANDLAETVRAKSAECEGLHKALRVSEANLKTLRETVAIGTRERDMARLKGNQRFVAEKPEPAIMGRRR